MDKLKPKIIVNNHRTLADKLVSEDEALTLKPYHCSAGKLTIGYGRNLEDNGISYEVAELMKAEDISAADNFLSAQAWYKELSGVRKAVLISMYFNLGWPRLTGFRKFLKALLAEDYNTAHDEMLDSRWALQVGVRAQRLALMMKFDREFSRAEASQWYEEEQ